MRFAQMILWRFALPKNSHLASPGSFCFPPPLAQASLARVEEKQNPSALLMGFLLPDLDWLRRSTPLCITQRDPPPRAAPFFIFIRLGEQVRHAPENKNPHINVRASLLPDLDSNQDKQNQNLSYYHYTIGQS